MFEIAMALVLLLLFVVGLIFAVYGLVCFVRRQRGGAENWPPAGDVAPLVEYAVQVVSGGAASSASHAASGSDSPAAAGMQGAGAPQTAGKAVPGTAHSSSWRPSLPGNLGQEGIMNNLFVRSLIVVFITLCLLIPLAFVTDIVDERAGLQQSAVRNIARQWGEAQTISGPALIIPYEIWRMQQESVLDEDGKTKNVTRRVESMEYKVVLPSRVSFEATLNPQTRQYGIYDYVVYTAPIRIRGTFRLPGEDFDKNLVRIHWDKAWFALGVTDLKAITKVENLVWNDKTCPPFNPGNQATGLLGPGFHTVAGLDPDIQEHAFSLTVNLNGSGGLQFTPVGETTDIKVEGAWPSPHFGGSLLPASRTISSSFFSAHWSIPHLSRTYPQVGDLHGSDFKMDASGNSSYRNDTGTLSAFTAGVDLYETVSLYRQVLRAVKYGILFIGLTYVALFSFELVTKARLHFMQYALVGVAMTLFYLVLLSLAEHTSFIRAFLAASGASVLMNGLYITAAMRSKTKGLIIIFLLSGLYGVLYALLRMEDYALLVGTALVVVVVGVLMYLTRHLPVGGSAGNGGGKPSRGALRASGGVAG